MWSEAAQHCACCCVSLIVKFPWFFTSVAIFSFDIEFKTNFLSDYRYCHWEFELSQRMLLDLALLKLVLSSEIRLCHWRYWKYCCSFAANSRKIVVSLFVLIHVMVWVRDSFKRSIYVPVHTHVKSESNQLSQDLAVSIHPYFLSTVFPLIEAPGFY